jgi:hypothetical protein
MRKLIILAASIAALAAPTAAMAAQPVDPGLFGTTRADNIITGVQEGVYPHPSRIGEWFANIGGDNGTVNQDWREDNPESMPQQ